MKRLTLTTALFLLAACVATSTTPKKQESTPIPEDTAPQDSPEDTGPVEGALAVSAITTEKCDQDTGDRYCNGRRNALVAEDRGSGTVGVEHIGYLMSCASVSAKARAIENAIEVSYIFGQGADCNCEHFLMYEIYDVEAGAWTVKVGSEEVAVEVAAP